MISVIIAAICGAAVTGLIGIARDKRKEKNEKQKHQQESFHNRPEFKIENYYDYISRTGYGIKKDCDLSIFVAKIDYCRVSEERGKEIVDAYYNEDAFDPAEWCCVIYELKNVGHTDISRFSITCNIKKTICIIESQHASWLKNDHILNYAVLYDKKLRVNESVLVKFCFHKDCVLSGMVSAMISIWIIDDNQAFWIQPLFVPRNKIYDSRRPCKEFHENYFDAISTEEAEKCFIDPTLW